MCKRSTARITFNDTGDSESRENSGRHAALFEGVLQGQCIHDGRQHAHVVGLGSIHALCTDRHAAKEIAAAHHQRELHAGRHDIANFTNDTCQHLAIDAEGFFAHQRLTTQLEQYASVGGEFVLLRRLARQGISLP